MYLSHRVTTSIRTLFAVVFVLFALTTCDQVTSVDLETLGADGPPAASERPPIDVPAGGSSEANDDDSLEESSETTAEPVVAPASSTAWLASGPGDVEDVTDVDGNPTMHYRASADSTALLTWTFSTVSADAAQFTIPYAFSGNHGEQSGLVVLQSFVDPGNGKTLSSLVSAQFDGGFAIAGSADFSVTPGAQYGFQVLGYNAQPAAELSGTLTIEAANQPPIAQIIDIDIRPDSDRNIIHPDSEGVVPVVVFGSSELDVTGIDPASIAFGPAAASPAHGGNGHPDDTHEWNDHHDGHEPSRREDDANPSDSYEPAGHSEDVNGDGLTDLVLHFRQNETGLTPFDTEAKLSALTLDGAPVEGTDSVEVRDYNLHRSSSLYVRRLY